MVYRKDLRSDFSLMVQRVMVLTVDGGTLEPIAYLQ